MRRVSFRITGHVQGVFFRKFAKESAEALGVTGFIENGPDGSVRGEAEGSEEAVAAFLGKMRSGPPRARITAVEETTLPLKGEGQGFQITTVRLV